MYLSGIARLKSLNLSGNLLSSSASVQIMLNQMVHLRELDLSYNHICGTLVIDQPLFKVREVKLDSNEIEAFVVGRPLQNLRKLSIRNNKI